MQRTPGSGSFGLNEVGKILEKIFQRIFRHETFWRNGARNIGGYRNRFVRNRPSRQRFSRIRRYGASCSGRQPDAPEFRLESPGSWRIGLTDERLDRSVEAVAAVVVVVVVIVVAAADVAQQECVCRTDAAAVAVVEQEVVGDEVQDVLVQAL